MELKGHHMKKIVRVKPKQTEFEHDNCLFTIEPTKRKQMKIWKLKKRFCPEPVEYRVLSDIKMKVPVAIQRLKAS